MHKKSMIIPAVVVLLAALLVSGVLAMSSGSYAIDWMVAMSGGGGKTTSTNYAVSLTFGQTTIGSTDTDNFIADLGYWFGTEAGWRLHVPIIMTAP